MSNIDKRIVEMEFDNVEFEKGVRETRSSLDKLRDSLNLESAADGIQQVLEKVNSWDLAGVRDGVGAIESRFTNLGIVGMEVLRNLTNAGINMARQMVSFFTTPIFEGGSKRAKNLEQARFQFQGLGMDVEQAMSDALYAVKGTAFGLDEAAVAASVMGASGVQLGDDMRTALRGVSGVAAMTNSQYGEIARIFTTVAGQGKLMTMQLRQIELRGINVAARMAKDFGVTEQAIRQMVTEGQISFEMFAQSMDDAFGEHSTKANETYSGSLMNVGAALARVGAMFYGPYYKKMTETWNALIPAIDSLAIALEPVRDRFMEIATFSIDHLVNVLKSLDFSVLTSSVGDFDGKLSGVARTLRGFFAFLDILRLFADAFVSALGKLINYLLPVGDGITGVTGGLGDLVVKLRDTIKETDIFNKAFSAIGRTFKPITDIIKKFTVAILNLFTSFSDKQIEDFPDKVDIKFRPLVALANLLKNAFAGVKMMLDYFGPAISKMVAGSKEAFAELFRGIGTALTSGDLKPLIDVLNTGLFGYLLHRFTQAIHQAERLLKRSQILGRLELIFFGLSRALKSLSAMITAKSLITMAFAIGVLTASLLVLSTVDPVKMSSSLTAVAVGLSQLLIAMNFLSKITTAGGAIQISVLSGSLIALSVGMLILAGAVKTLSKLSWEELAKGLIGVVITLIAITTAMKAMTSINVTKMGGVLILAAAMHVLAGAVAKFGELDTDSRSGIKGLMAMAAVLGMISLFTESLGSGKNLIATSVGMIALGIAMRLFTKSIEDFGSMKFEDLLKGLIGLGATLAIITAATMVLPRNIIGVSAGLILMAAAIRSLALTLTVIASIESTSLANSLLALVVMLGSLVVALELMEKSLPGSAALLVASAALIILASALKVIGSMSIEQLTIGLLGFATALGVIGATAVLLGPISPLILSLAVSIGALALAALGIGAALSLFAVGIGLLATAGTAGAIALKAAVTVIIELVPYLMEKIAEGLIRFLELLGNSGERIRDAFLKILNVLFDGIIDFLVLLEAKVPEIVDIVTQLIVTLVASFKKNAPLLVQAAFDLILAIVNGLADAIRDNYEEVFQAGINIVVAIIEAIVSMFKQIFETGVDFLKWFVDGIKNGFDESFITGEEVAEQATDGMRSGSRDSRNVGRDMVDGMIDGVGSRESNLTRASSDVASKALDAIKKTLGIKSPSREFMDIGKYSGDGLIAGLLNRISNIKDTSGYLGDQASEALRGALSKALDILYGDLNLSPVITPVIDMTNAQTALAGLGGSIGLDTTNQASRAYNSTSVVDRLLSILDLPDPKPNPDQAASQMPYTIQIDIHDPVVREEEDIPRLAKAVSKEIFTMQRREGRARGIK